MKKYSIGILIGIIGLCFTACDKNSEIVSVEKPKNSHRIKQIIGYNYSDEPEWKSVYTYTGDNVIEILHFTKDGEGKLLECHKEEITYIGNKAISYLYVKESGDWKKTRICEYLLENDLIIEMIVSNYRVNHWTKAFKTTYQYSGDNLIAYQDYIYDESNSTFDPNYKGQFFYESNELKENHDFEMDESGNWICNLKQTFSFSAGNLIEKISFFNDEQSNTWKEFGKTINIYSGGKISEIENYNWDFKANIWSELPIATWYFDYNSNGYLIEEINHETGRKVFEYEEGHGNAKVFYVEPELLPFGGPSLKNISSMKHKIPNNGRNKIVR